MKAMRLLDGCLVDRMPAPPGFCWQFCPVPPSPGPQSPLPSAPESRTFPRNYTTSSDVLTQPVLRGLDKDMGKDTMNSCVRALESVLIVSERRACTRRKPMLFCCRFRVFSWGREYEPGETGSTATAPVRTDLGYPSNNGRQAPRDGISCYHCGVRG